MSKKAVILISLFSYSFLIYLPLSKLEIDLNTDDMCFFYDEITDNKKYYIKACDKGFICQVEQDDYDIGICLEYKPSLKKYNEKCSKSSECISPFKCIDNYCLVEENDSPYSIGIYSFCSNNTIAIKYEDVINSIYQCEKKSDHQDMDDKCFVSTPKKKSTSPDYLKVCGKIELDNNKKQSISTSNFGEIEDGNFVEDEKACKSGFALNFFLNGNTQTTTNMDFAKLCVTVKGVELGASNNDCIIRYTKGSEEEFIYKDDADMDPTLYSSNNFRDCYHIMTKIDLFQDYLKKFEKLKNHCDQGKYYNEPFTCENDELRKIWYLYNNPSLYLLYKNDEEIIDFFIQSMYPTPKSKLEENNKNSSGFFNNKYFLLLLLLLSF